MPHFSTESLVPEYLRLVKPYIPSRPDPELMRMFGCERLFRLNNNENPLGPPRPALDAIAAFDMKRLSIYPNGDAYYLRMALSEYYQMDENSFIVGNGANEVISAVIKAFCMEGDNIITADRTFSVYEWVASYAGCETRLVPLSDFQFDFEALLAAIDSRTKIIFICNPNNPTGTMWTSEMIRDFMERVDGRTIVVVDEAYLEYVDDCRKVSAVNFMKDYPNLIVLKTFSKMFALAGLRIGYLIAGNEVAEAVRRTVITYSVGSLAQVAAEAVVRGGVEVENHMASSRSLVREASSMLSECCVRLSLNHRCGNGNFVLIELPFSDSLAYRMLMEKGFMVRTMMPFRFPNWIRVTCSFADVMEPFCTALSDIVSRRV